MNLSRVLWLLAVSLVGPGCREAPQEERIPMTLQVTSSAFGEGETIPAKYTVDGQDISPPLAWSNPPSGTASFALICDDPDAPRGTTWVH